VKFAVTTPMKYILDKEFVVCINDKHYTSVLNFANTNEGLVNIDKSIEIKVKLLLKGFDVFLRTILMPRP